MKKSLMALVMAGALANVAHAADATATAQWQASAKKDNTNKSLTVTPLGTLNFEYAAGLKTFNKVTGMFDVKIEGDEGTTEVPTTGFTLQAKKLSGSLEQLGGTSKLDVDVKWAGSPLAADTFTTLIDTKKGINGGQLSAIGEGFQTGASAQAGFEFSIGKATVDGSAVTMDKVPDGVFSGIVEVEFSATWI